MTTVVPTALIHILRPLLLKKGLLILLAVLPWPQRFSANSGAVSSMILEKPTAHHSSENGCYKPCRGGIEKASPNILLGFVTLSTSPNIFIPQLVGGEIVHHIINLKIFSIIITFVIWS